MQSVSYNGTGYDIPDNGDRTWLDLTDYLVALASGSLVKAGGSFVLTNDVNFGTSKGLIAKYFTSVTAGAASTGAVRLANTDSISFRNSLNTLDLPLSLSTNTLQFNSLSLALLASTLTASRALASDASGNLVSSATTAAQLGYLSTASSDIQTQITTNLSTLTTHTGASTGVHGVTGAVVGTTGTQTLTNKTLTSPIIAAIVNTGTLTLPTSSDTMVGRATTDTLTNKTIAAASNTITGLTTSNLSASAGILPTQLSRTFIAQTSSVYTPGGGVTGIYPTMTNNFITPAAGIWTLKGVAVFDNGGVNPTYVSIVAKWSSANGANSGSAPANSTVQAGYSGVIYGAPFPVNNSAGVIVLPEIRVSANGSTSYYLTPFYDVSGTTTNVRLTTYIYAEQIG